MLATTTTFVTVYTVPSNIGLAHCGAIRSPRQMGCGGSVRSSACYTGAARVAVAEAPAEAAAPHTASGDNTGDAIRYLSQLPRAQCSFAIQLAAIRGDMDAVRYLCELPRDQGVDPSTGHNTAVQWAALLGHVDVVRYLCELPADRGVHPGAYDNYAISWAAYNGHVDVVRYLCELPGDRGVDPGADDNAAIRWAVEYGHSGRRCGVVRRQRGLEHAPIQCTAWAR